MNKALQALEDISVEFDECGYEPTIIGVPTNRHFVDIWRKQFDIIKKALTPPTAEERKNFKEWLEFNINKVGYTKEDMEFVIGFLMKTIPSGYGRYNLETFSELSKDLQELKGGNK